MSTVELAGARRPVAAEWLKAESNVAHRQDPLDGAVAQHLRQREDLGGDITQLLVLRSHLTQQEPTGASSRDSRPLRDRWWLRLLPSEVPFMVGYYFSVADITGVVMVDFATKALGLPIPEDHVALKHWYELVSARPSIAA